jgi:hypothetical protein
MTALQKQIQKLAYEGRHYKIQNKNKVKNARLENRRPRPLDSAPPNLRMNRPAGRFTNSKVSEDN